MIYFHTLIVSHDLSYLYRMKPILSREKTVGLLCDSRQIHFEAHHVLYAGFSPVISSRAIRENYLNFVNPRGIQALRRCIISLDVDWRPVLLRNAYVFNDFNKQLQKMLDMLPNLQELVLAIRVIGKNLHVKSSCSELSAEDIILATLKPALKIDRLRVFVDSPYRDRSSIDAEQTDFEKTDARFNMFEDLLRPMKFSTIDKPSETDTNLYSKKLVPYGH